MHGLNQQYASLRGSTDCNPHMETVQHLTYSTKAVGN